MWRGRTLEVPLTDEVVGPEGATLLVGRDGRLYLIPDSLEACEVLDEKAKLDLWQEAGRERGSMTARALPAGSAAVARSAALLRSAAFARSAAFFRSATLLR
jgi:hypothetical protein